MKSSKHHDVLGSEYLGVLCRYLREEGELACLCLVSALVIQLVLLCSVLRRFVHPTGCGKHLFVIIIIIIIIIVIIIYLERIARYLEANVKAFLWIEGVRKKKKN